MPSDPSLVPGSSGGSEPQRWEWLSSQGLGIVCGQASVLLLAIASIALAATREGASAGIAMDDMRGFFDSPSPVHLWFYLLLPVFGLYAINVGVATWRNVARKWRSGFRAPRFYAAAVIHVAFLVGLLAHAISGFGGGESGRLTLGPSWEELGDGRWARVTALDVERHPDGSTKQVRASVELRDREGATTWQSVRYNAPLSRALGSELWLLSRPGFVPAVRLARGSLRCEVEVGKSCHLGVFRVEPLYLHPPTRGSRSATVRVRVETAEAPPLTYWLAPGRAQGLADGSRLSFEGVETRPAIQLRRRHAPGNPWALLASVLLVLGLALMWRRLLPAAWRTPG